MNVPFSKEYPEGLLDKQITINATVNSWNYRFTINLSAGNDIAFHFNPYVKDSKIVMNSYIDGCWGKEEIDGSFPFAVGQSFVMKIEVNKTYVKVRVDKSDPLTFKQRLKNPGAIKRLEINGDLKLSDVDVVDA